jgi:hypothetical protein
MKSEIRLFSYKLTVDSGFAPNPFHGVMTLATCKPKIRESKKPGDWLAGFTSIGLNGDEAGYERLIYLMQVTDKIFISEYWNNPAYEVKKPTPDATRKNSVGDNIYKPVVGNPISHLDFEQIPNRSHKPENAEKDLSGRYVLISKKFWYFGCNPVELPADIRPDIPKGQSSQGNMTHDLARAMRFIEFIESNYKKGIHNNPTGWKKHDPGCKSK